MTSPARVLINRLVDLVEHAAGIAVRRRHVPGPQGVRGRNADNRRVCECLGWGPRITLEEGLAHTSAWIEQQVRAGRLAEPSRARFTSI